MQYAKAELVYSKRRGQEAIVFVGSARHDLKNKTIVQDKMFLWDTDSEFKKIKKELKL